MTSVQKTKANQPTNNQCWSLIFIDYINSKYINISYHYFWFHYLDNLQILYFQNPAATTTCSHLRTSGSTSHRAFMTKDDTPLSFRCLEQSSALCGVCKYFLLRQGRRDHNHYCNGWPRMERTWPTIKSIILDEWPLGYLCDLFLNTNITSQLRT